MYKKIIIAPSQGYTINGTLYLQYSQFKELPFKLPKYWLVSMIDNGQYDNCFKQYRLPTVVVTTERI